MTAEVVTLHRQTPLDFIKRNGPTLTAEFAQRFALDHRDALKLLKRLEAQGLITSRMVGISFIKAGSSGLEWRAMP